MERLDTRLEGPVLVKPVIHGDERGFFHESYRRNVYAELGIPEEFVQDNHSRSRHGIVRGMHFQVGHGAAKLVSCARGAILDVVVDIRRGSPTFGEWEAFELTDENLHKVYCPIGFAHGFCVLSEQADVMYKQAPYYDDGARARHRLQRPGRRDRVADGHRARALSARRERAAAARHRERAPVRVRADPGGELANARRGGEAGAHHVVLERVAPGTLARHTGGKGTVA